MVEDIIGFLYIILVILSDFSKTMDTLLQQKEKKDMFIFLSVTLLIPAPAPLPDKGRASS